MTIWPLLAQGQSVPSFAGAVNDQAQMLPRATRLYLKHMLEDYRAQTGHQLAFLSVDSLDGLAPEVFALKVVESWKLGRALADDGLLLLIAKHDRRVRIEVGYGLEGTIPDAIANRVVDEVLTPALRREQFAWGVLVSFKTLMRHADEHSAKVVSDPVAALLGVEAPVVASYMNDRAQLFDEPSSQRLNGKLAKIAAEYGMTLAVLTMRCPDHLQLDRCVDAVNELWSGPLAFYDGLVTLFVQTTSESETTGNSGQAARLTLDRMATPPKQAWRRGVDSASEIEAALGELAERAGVVWKAPDPAPRPPPVDVSPPRAAAQRSDSTLTYQQKVIFVLMASVLLGVLGLAYVVHRAHARSAVKDGRAGEQASFLRALMSWLARLFLSGGSSEDSSASPYHGRGGGNWGSGGDGGGGDNGRAAGEGSFGGGGASGRW